MREDPTKARSPRPRAAPLVALALAFFVLPGIVGRTASPAFSDDFESGGLAA
jgi:hypothetical protein